MFSLDIAGIAISVFFILFILSKKKRKNTDLLLLLSNLATIGLLLVDAMFQRQLTSWVFFLLNTIPLFYFPLFLIYALEMLAEKIHHRGRWALLFLPALITSAYIASDLFILHNYNQAQLDELYNHPSAGYHLLCKGFPIVFIIVFIWLINRLKKYRASLKESYSFIAHVELNWLTNSTWIYLFITVISLMGFIASQFQILPISSHLVCSLIGILLFLAIFYVSFHGIRHYTVAEYYGVAAVPPVPPEPRPALTKDPGSDKADKYRSSSLTDSSQNSIFEKVTRLFEEKKVYQDPQLQLSDVAEALQVTTNNLSQTINTATGKPFYDFVNGYRVRHLQKLLEDPAQKEFTILTMGFESGFNSKATLNRVFRQHTGLTPSEYSARNQKK
jgi:AraC-like DNA-binding protein